MNGIETESVSPRESTSWTIDIHLRAADLSRALRADVRRGLFGSPKELSPKWFYDERGSKLFEIITRLPEYYPTAREREILRARSAEIAQIAAPETLVELGSGTSEKTRLLLDSLVRGGRLRRFVPFDVSESTLRDAAASVASTYPQLRVHAVVGDFERHLRVLPKGGRRLIAFLGGTIGNFKPASRVAFYAQLASQLAPGDSLLLGTDLVKDVRRLEAAYNDSAGVTAEFNRNILLVLNRELGADFIPARFEHVARFDPRQEWMEMWLRSSSKQQVRLRSLRRVAHFSPGEEMLTEISAKFRREGVQSELASAGLRLTHWWMDEVGDYALSLSQLSGDRTPAQINPGA
jgi:L-histidine N-alpha-methyltransferase